MEGGPHEVTRLAPVIALALALLAAPLVAEAQNIPRIGYLSIYTPSYPRGVQWRAAFQRGLREHGLRRRPRHRHRVPVRRWQPRPIARSRDRAGRVPVDVILVQGESAARQLGLELYGRDVRKGDDLEPAFSALTRARVGSVILVADFVFVGHRRAIARLATSRRLPLMGWGRGWSEAGALLSYGAGTGDVQRRVASYVAKILKGARAADLPVEEATRFELVINLKTAKALGLTIPPSVLARADAVIE